MLSPPNHTWSDNSAKNNLSESVPPNLFDNTVDHILDMYAQDTDLLKHILAAKTEEDRRRAAEEMRRTEEIRLQCKYMDWILANNEGQTTQDLLSLLEDSTSTNVARGWLSPLLPTAPPPPGPPPAPPMTTSLPHEAPPSPTKSLFRPTSPYQGLVSDMPFADLSISAPSSPEPSDVSSKEAKERACKRTLSRARSQRRPQVGEKKKYRSMPPSTRTDLGLFSPPSQPISQPQEQLDHSKVMEALRAKLRRSSNPPKHTH